jgi:hypothetical protein
MASTSMIAIVPQGILERDAATDNAGIRSPPSRVDERTLTSKRRNSAISVSIRPHRRGSIPVVASSVNGRGWSTRHACDTCMSSLIGRSLDIIYRDVLERHSGRTTATVRNVDGLRFTFDRLNSETSRQMSSRAWWVWMSRCSRADLLSQGPQRCPGISAGLVCAAATL